MTPQNLFRGQFFAGDGNVQGPYVSQFMFQPTFLGVQPLTQMYRRFLSVGEVEGTTAPVPPSIKTLRAAFRRRLACSTIRVFRFLRMGRDGAAYTHVDALHQAYFVAVLVLAGIGCAS